MPFALAGRLVVQAATSKDPGADAVGTLYLNCLFRPGLPQALVDQIYAWAPAVAIPGALPPGSRARVTPGGSHRGSATRAIPIVRCMSPPGPSGRPRNLDQILDGRLAEVEQRARRGTAGG